MDILALLVLDIQTVPKFHSTYRHTKTFASGSKFKYCEISISSQFMSSHFCILLSSNLLNALNKIIDV